MVAATSALRAPQAVVEISRVPRLALHLTALQGEEFAGGVGKVRGLRLPVGEGI